MTRHRTDADGSVPDDVVGSEIANIVSLAAIEEVYGGDVYGADDEWARDVRNLGENS